MSLVDDMEEDAIKYVAPAKDVLKLTPGSDSKK